MVVTGFLIKSVTYLKPYIPIDYKYKIRKVTGLQSISLINDLLIIYIYIGVG